MFTRTRVYVRYLVRYYGIGRRVYECVLDNILKIYETV